MLNAFAPIERPLQEWVERRYLKPVPVALLLRTMAGMILGLILQRALGDSVLQERWEELPDLLTDLLLHGIEASTP